MKGGTMEVFVKMYGTLVCLAFVTEMVLCFLVAVFLED